MPTTKLSGFKGLAQHVVYEELSPEYCHTLINIDVDDPVGRLSKRGGYTKKFSGSYTDIISAYEYQFPTSGETILLFNDNGTLKYYKNGTFIGSLTLPSGSALAANFRNQYFGWKDRIQITTGNGATNHVLGFYYLNRENDDNTGLFGNNEEFTGYKLLKSQLICPHGLFSRVYNSIYHDGYYYFTFENSKYIEKRDTNFQLISRFVADSGASNYTTVSLDTDGTYIYMGIKDSASSRDGIYRIDPNGWIVDEFLNLADVIDVAVDDTQLYVCQTVGTERLAAYDKTDFTTLNSEDVTAFVGFRVACFDSGETHIYSVRSDGGTITLERRDKTAVGTVSHTYTTSTTAITDIVCETNVWLTLASIGEIREVDKDDITLSNTYTHLDSPASLLVTAADGLKVIDATYGVMADDTTAALYRPDLLAAHLSTGTGALDTGTYFYKFSLVDVDGQEFTLSDSVIFSHNSGTAGTRIITSLNEAQIDDLYRVKYINIYRAYNSDQEAEIPATNYKFLKQIDINSNGWINNATLGYYYYDYTDNITEDTIGSTTFLENAGFSDNTKPKYVNYKVSEWINNELHAANLYVDKEYPNTIAKSQFNAPDVVPFANTYDFDPYDGDEILNLTTAYSRIYAMKNRRTGIFYEDILERVVNIGLADTDSFHKETDTIYLISNKGLFELNGANLRDLTPNVITYFEAIASFTDAVVFYRDDKKRLLFSIPQDRVLCVNLVHNLYTSYSTDYAFRGYFKNLENQYIAFGKGQGDNGHYFWLLNDTSQDNGGSMTVTYESPLLKMAEFDGIDIELTKLQYRNHHTGSVNFIIYSYVQGSKLTIESFTLEDPASTSQAVETCYLDNVWGEAFSIYFTGTVTVFQFSSISIFGELAGETANV